MRWQFCFTDVRFRCCLEAGESNVVCPRDEQLFAHPQHFPLWSRKVPLCQCTEGGTDDLSDHSSHETCLALALALAPGLVMLAQSRDCTTPGILQEWVWACPLLGAIYF